MPCVPGTAALGSERFRGFIAFQGRLIRRIQSGQRHIAPDLLHDPGFQAFLLDGERNDLTHQGLRNHNRSVIVRYDDIIRVDRDTTTADRLTPPDERKPRNGRRCCLTATPDRKVGSQHSRNVANHTVGHQPSRPTPAHSRAQDVAEDACVLHTHGVHNGNAAGRHGFDGRAGRSGIAPGLRGRKILSRRNEPQCERFSDQSCLARAQWTASPDPDVPQSPAQQNCRESCCRDISE